MKNVLSMAVALMILIFSTQVQAKDFEVDYGDSKLYTQREMDNCISMIDEHLTSLNCTLINVRYAGDGISKKELERNGIDYSKNYENFIIFYADFQSPPDPHDGKPTAWTYDKLYKDYNFIFGFDKNDGWQLVNYGY